MDACLVILLIILVILIAILLCRKSPNKLFIGGGISGGASVNIVEQLIKSADLNDKILSAHLTKLFRGLDIQKAQSAGLDAQRLSTDAIPALTVENLIILAEKLGATSLNDFVFKANLRRQNIATQIRNRKPIALDKDIVKLVAEKLNSKPEDSAKVYNQLLALSEYYSTTYLDKLYLNALAYVLTEINSKSIQLFPKQKSFASDLLDLNSMDLFSAYTKEPYLMKNFMEKVIATYNTIYTKPKYVNFSDDRISEKLNDITKQLNMMKLPAIRPTPPRPQPITEYRPLPQTPSNDFISTKQSSAPF